MDKLSLISGSLFALLSIVSGAFGAHALKDHLNEYSKMIYEKAVMYQMFHSIGLILVGVLSNQLSANFVLVSWLFIIGILLFSGSLYILAVTDIKWIGAITPIGGSLFIIGWAMLLLKVLNFNM